MRGFFCGFSRMARLQRMAVSGLRGRLDWAGGLSGHGSTVMHQVKKTPDVTFDARGVLP